MPERITFEAGERVLASDLNNVGVKSEEGFLGVAKALIGVATGDAIFNASVDASIVVGGGGPYSIDAGELFFAASGYVGYIAGPFSDSYAVASDLYAVIERYIDSDTRVVASGSPPVEASVAVDVAVLEDVRYEVHPTATPPTPTLGGTVYYIRVAELTIAPAKVFDPDGLLYTFPGAPVPIGAHGATHLPGGGDEVPVAVLAGPTSSPGLLGTDELVTLRNAITDITVSLPLDVTITGDNTPGGTPKTADLGLLLASVGPGLTVTDGLRVSFAGTGSSPMSARSDHRHTFLQYAEWAVPTPISVGTLISNTFPVGTFAGDQIRDAQVYYVKGTKRILLSPNPGGGLGYYVITDGSTVKVLFHTALMVVHTAVAIELGTSTTLGPNDGGATIVVVAVGERSSS